MGMMFEGVNVILTAGVKKGACLDIKVQRRETPQMNTANSLEASNFESGRIHEECDWIHSRG